MKPHLKQIIGLGDNDIFQGYIGKIYPNPDKILREEAGGRGIELYEDMLRDPQIAATLQTRTKSVIGKEWKVTPATDKRNDVKVADFVTNVLLGFNFDYAREALLTGLFFGFKPSEIMWEYSEGIIIVKEIIPCSCRQFAFDVDGKLRLLTMESMFDGELLPDKKFIVFRNPSIDSNPYGSPIASKLYWYWWFKKNVIKFWMMYADKYAFPTVMAKYPQEVNDNEQDDLLYKLETIQQDSTIVLPENINVEFLEASRQSSTNTYESICTYMDNAIAKVILGQTLTTEIGKTGSYAASKTHNEVRHDILKADADLLCHTLNETVVKWLVDFNFANVKKYPQIWIETEEQETLKEFAERDKMLFDLGLPLSKQYLYDKYGITPPEDDDDVLVVSQGSIEQPAQGSQKNRMSLFSKKTVMMITLMITLMINLFWTNLSTNC